MIEYVWICEETAQLHVTYFNEYNWHMWRIFDQQSFERAFEQSEPLMQLNFTYTYLGQL